MAPSADSFEAFAAENVRALLRTAYLITSDAGEAEDLVQECLLRVSRQWRRVTGMERPVAYSRRVLVNLAVRGSGRRIRHRSELGAFNPESGRDPGILEQIGIRDELSRALRQLPARQRAVLVLRYFFDLSDPEIAETLEWPLGTVKSNAARSLATLRGLMESMPSEKRRVQQ
jgi:RNA polymerase sigma-70 factor (sigma-E family)